MYQVIPIQAFSDNYIWCLKNDNNAVIVDPGDAAPVISYLTANNLDLAAILVTHHHPDHIGGINELKTHFPDVIVYGPENSKIPQVTQIVKNDECIELAKIDAQFNVIEIPGHTLDHIAYFDDTSLFCGDTLFSGGCGRLFEGSPEQMMHSLEKLTNLPANTAVYCAHEYTLANLSFASHVEPNNADLKRYIATVNKLRENNQPSLPTSIGQELKVNPFIRAHSANIKQTCENHFNSELTDELSVFTATRKWKDNF